MLNTYWLVLSLILLFEHAFLKLLEWLLLWQYIRIMIVYWLVIPHFDGAVYVYKHLICPCLTMDPQIVIKWFNKRRNESSCIRESFLAELERYVQENGPEALERIVACKVIQTKHNLTGTGNSKFAAMEIKEKAIEVVADRNIMKTPPLNEVQKGWTFNSDLDSKNLKNAIEAPKARNQAEPRLTQIGNGAVAAVEASVNPIEIATGRELIESTQNVRKEWTGALEVTIPSERTLNSNLIRIHKASHEALNAKRQAYVPKMALAKSDKHEEPGKSIPSVASKPMVIINQAVSQAEPDLTGTENSRFPSMDIKEKAIGIASERGILNIPPSEKVQEWTSAVSHVTTQSDTTFNSYPDGKIHEAVYEKSKIENKAEPKLTQMENGTFVTMETQEKVVEVVTSIESALQVQKEWTCALCQLTTQSEATLNSHLQGRKHKAACVALKAKSRPFAPKIAPASTAKESNQPNKERGKSTTSSASKQKVIVDEKVQSQKNSIPTSRTKTSDKSKKEPAEGASINGGQQRNRKEVPSKKDYRIWCKICNVHCPGEIDLASHLSGMRHEENVLEQQQKANSVPRMKGPPLWCKICNVGCYTLVDMVSHRNGGRHLDLLSTGM